MAMVIVDRIHYRVVTGAVDSIVVGTGVKRFGIAMLGTQVLCVRVFDS